MVNVYTDKFTPRLKYIVEDIFRHILSNEVTFYKNIEEARKCDGPLICYSREIIEPGAINIYPHGLLFQADIRKQDIKVERWNDSFIFFTTNDERYSLPFDVFSAAFFLVSRYEEYGAPLDSEGRFQKENSVAYQNGFLNRPIVDEWAYMLEAMLIETGKYTPAEKIGYRVHSSVMIERPYKYRYCSVLATIKKLCSKLLRGDFKSFKNQMKVLLYLANDPYDNLDDILSLHTQVNLMPSFFVLIKKGKKDCRNKYASFRSLRKGLRRSYVVGLHPSYNSGSNTKTLNKELVKLEHTIVKTRVTTNMFYNLKFSLPTYYESLLKIGIGEDFSMGYHDAMGFRASTCTPFRFYDLKHEAKTRLYVHSIVFSGRSLRESGMHRREIYRQIIPLIDRVKSVNGQMCCVVSNCSLSDFGSWKGWKGMLTRIYRYASMLETSDKTRAEMLNEE